jgi:hypothetical protein
MPLRRDCRAFQTCDYATPFCTSDPESCEAPSATVTVTLPRPVVDSILEGHAESVLEHGIDGAPWSSVLLNQVIPQLDRGLSGRAHMN